MARRRVLIHDEKSLHGPPRERNPQLNRLVGEAATVKTIKLRLEIEARNKRALRFQNIYENKIRADNLSALSVTTICLFLCTFGPACEVLFLLRGELVDFDAHGFEFQFGDALVELIRNLVDSLFECLVVLYHELN